MGLRRAGGGGGGTSLALTMSAGRMRNSVVSRAPCSTTYAARLSLSAPPRRMLVLHLPSGSIWLGWWWWWWWRVTLVVVERGCGCGCGCVVVVVVEEEVVVVMVVAAVKE